MFECCDCGKPTDNSCDVNDLSGNLLFTIHRCDACEEQLKLEMDFQSEGETIEIDTLVCPWCGYEYEDHESCRYYDIGSEEEVDCPSCGRKFDLEVQTAVRFSTKRSLCEMPEDYGKEEQDD